MLRTEKNNLTVLCLWLLTPIAYVVSCQRDLFRNKLRVPLSWFGVNYKWYHERGEREVKKKGRVRGPVGVEGGWRVVTRLTEVHSSSMLERTESWHWGTRPINQRPSHSSVTHRHTQQHLHRRYTSPRKNKDCKVWLHLQVLFTHT